VANELVNAVLDLLTRVKQPEGIRGCAGRI
jgi:hypothetical protein